MQPIIGSPDIPADLFHYTTATGLRGMVKNREIWATESNYLNDPSEIEFAANRVIARLSERIADGLTEDATTVATSAVDLLRAAYVDPHTLEQYREDRSFITSFSRSDTSLTLWRTYAGENGFCVGFLEEELLRWMGKDYPGRPDENAMRGDREEHDALVANYQLESSVYDVHYGDVRIDSMVDAVLALDGRLEPPRLEAHLRAVFKWLPETKHSAFSDEREARLVVQEVGHHAPDSDVRVATNGGLIAFHKLVFPFEAIRSITVAPGANVAQTTRALHSLMRQGGRGPWSHVSIRETGIPFNW